MRLKITLTLLSLFSFIISEIGTAQTLLPPARTGNFFVSSYNADSVAVYDSSGNYLHHFGAEGLNGPRGVVFAPNNKVYIASQLSDEIYVFDRNEQYLTQFSDEELDGPTGMAVIDSTEHSPAVVLMVQIVSW